MPNPIPLENFPVLPVVTSDAYGYGENGSRPEARAALPPNRRWPRGGRGGRCGWTRSRLRLRAGEPCT